MQLYSETILARGTGLALRDALVTIYDTGTTDKATLYAENDVGGATLANPLTSDEYGRISAYIPDGLYDLRVDHNANPTYTIERVQVFDWFEHVDDAVSGITDPELLALAGLTSASNKLPYFTGAGAADVAEFTNVSRELLDDTTFAAMRVTLGLNDIFAANALVDPNADRIAFWDDSAGALEWLSLGSGLTITATTLDLAAGAYQAGGTDVALADGGTGASLADPNADRMMFWDDSAGAVDWLTPGSTLAISGTTIDVASSVYQSGGTDVALADGGTGASLADPGADRIMFWDDSAGVVTWLQMGTGLAITGDTLDATASAVEATDSEIWTGSDTTKIITPRRLFTAAAPQTLTSASSVAINGNNGINFNLTLDQNTTLANPTNMKAGQSGRIRITQDGTGGWTLGFGANWSEIGDPTAIGATAGDVTILAYYANSSSDIEVCLVGEVA